MEALVRSLPTKSRTLELEDKSDHTVNAVKRPAPLTSGCRIEGFVRVKRVNQTVLLITTDHRCSFFYLPFIY